MLAAERKAFQEARKCVHALFPEAYIARAVLLMTFVFLMTGTEWVERRALYSAD